jgi:uncharacterized coiled-coil DUF342 family protein
MSTRTLMRLLIPLMSLALVLVACGQDKGAANDAANKAAEMADEAGDAAEQVGEMTENAAGMAEGQMSAVIQAFQTQLDGMEKELASVKSKVDMLPAGVKDQAATKFTALEKNFANLKTDLDQAKAQLAGADEAQAEQVVADVKEKFSTELSAAGKQLEELKSMLASH